MIKSVKTTPRAYESDATAPTPTVDVIALFFFNETATPDIYTSIDTLSLHDALPIFLHHRQRPCIRFSQQRCQNLMRRFARSEEHTSELQSPIDISYAVFCLKKK